MRPYIYIDDCVIVFCYRALHPYGMHNMGLGGIALLQSFASLRDAGGATYGRNNKRTFVTVPYFLRPLVAFINGRFASVWATTWGRPYKHTVCFTYSLLMVRHCGDLRSLYLTATIYGCPTTISDRNIFIVTYTPQQPIPPLRAY